MRLWNTFAPPFEVFERLGDATALSEARQRLAKFECLRSRQGGVLAEERE
jgi:hypothetical protein